MRSVTFREAGGTGPFRRTHQPLSSFLLRIPNLFYFGCVPSLNVVNAFLKDGISDAGMSGGCKWKPFEIGAEEYLEVIECLQRSGTTHQGRPLRFADVPQDVRSKVEWAAWVLHVECGTPHEEHLRLIKEERSLLEQSRKEAEKANNQDSATRAHLQWFTVASKLAEFERPFLEAYRDRRIKGRAE